MEENVLRLLLMHCFLIFVFYALFGGVRFIATRFELASRLS